MKSIFKPLIWVLGTATLLSGCSYTFRSHRPAPRRDHVAHPSSPHRKQPRQYVHHPQPPRQSPAPVPRHRKVEPKKKQPHDSTRSHDNRRHEETRKKNKRNDHRAEPQDERGKERRSDPQDRRR